MRQFPTPPRIGVPGASCIRPIANYHLYPYTFRHADPVATQAIRSRPVKLTSRPSDVSGTFWDVLSTPPFRPFFTPTRRSCGMLESPVKLSTFLLPLALLVACGGSEPESKPTKADTTAQKKPAPKPEPKPEPKVEIVVDDGTTVTVNLTGSDAMKYNTSAIEVAAGRTVKVNLKHIGRMPVNQMGHNFVLLAKGTDVAAFVRAGANAQDTGYVADSMKDKVIAKTKLIGGGESDTIEFAAPEPGVYDFICSFPNHAAVMKGKLTVK